MTTRVFCHCVRSLRREIDRIIAGASNYRFCGLGDRHAQIYSLAIDMDKRVFAQRLRQSHKPILRAGANCCRRSSAGYADEEILRDEEVTGELEDRVRRV